MRPPLPRPAAACGAKLPRWGRHPPARTKSARGRRRSTRRGAGVALRGPQAPLPHPPHRSIRSAAAPRPPPSPGELPTTFGNHPPLKRQSESFAREGIDLDVSTLADWVGACSATLAPLVDLIRSHVFDAARLHGDDTTVPVLAKMKTRTCRLVGLAAGEDRLS